MYNVDVWYGNQKSNILYRREMTLKADTEEEANANLSILFKNFYYNINKINKVN